jgi:acyl transferase domain-containing protein
MSAPLMPIAIVGVSCRFPGDAHDLGSLWQNLEKGDNAWSDVPQDRYNMESFHHPSRDSNVAHSHRGGHFLAQDIATFDANFFGITAAEADAMDPQQRLQLEIAYEALENAGMSLDKVKGSNTGVYVATFTHDYENMMYMDTVTMPKYGMTGVGQAIVSNRISYTFDLRGPSLTLDTGCSGSLVALHQACQSLRLRESSMALVGGTNLIISPDTMIPMDNLQSVNDL